MGSRITPMIHVPDVAATAAWYRAVGFELAGWHGCDAESGGKGAVPAGVELDWALLRWGADGVMLSPGGAASDAARREFDLYIDLDTATDSVNALYARLPEMVDVVEPPYDAFHGNRELIVRDCIGFWITFAEPVRPKASS
jgi:hypothetical protein